MKRIISLLILFILIFSLSSCSLYGERENVTVGDIIYLHVKTQSQEYYSVVGLSEEGKEKREIVIPGEVNGLEVRTIGFLRGLKRVGSITSDNLETIYLEKYMDFCFSYFFIDCPKLKKIICLEFKDISRDEFYSASDEEPVIINNKGKENEEVKSISIYIFPSQDYLEFGERLYSYANVVYYLDKNTVYYIDFYDQGKITYFPEEPIKYGYKFVGWYKESECINKWDYESDLLPEILKEDDVLTFKVTRLYAKWVEEYV